MKMKIAVLAMVMVFLIGCTPVITQPMQEGSKLLVSAYDGLEKDYETMNLKLADFLKYATPDSGNEYKAAKDIFETGFKALKVALVALNDAIVAAAKGE